MGRKLILPAQALTIGGVPISGRSMTSTVTSDAIPIQFEDSICFQMNWTGTPVGTFDVQGSVDGLTWDSLTLSNVISAAGAAGHGLMDLFGLSFPWIRLVYNPSSSTGSLNAFVGGKNLSS